MHKLCHHHTQYFWLVHKLCSLDVSDLAERNLHTGMLKELQVIGYGDTGSRHAVIDCVVRCSCSAIIIKCACRYRGEIDVSACDQVVVGRQERGGKGEKGSPMIDSNALK